tara:strand:- start:398 stop:1123 length:726 start_codon:yes stop_codon:yes gene_type:complete
MRWKFIKDVSGEKGDTVFEALNFYSNLKAKDYALIVIDELEKNVWMLQDDEKMFVTEPSKDSEEICPSGFGEYLELTMANAVIRLNDTIPQDSPLRDKTKSGKNLMKGIQSLYQNGNIFKISEDDRKDIALASMWNIEDEKMAIQTAIKSVLAEVLRFQFEEYSDDEENFSVFSSVAKEQITVSDFYNSLQGLKEKMEQSSIPTRRPDIEDINDESLDLIASAMFDEDRGYVNSVLDYIFK